MLSGVIFSWGESEPECWGLTEVGSTQWLGVFHQPRGRANCTKDGGREVTAGPLESLVRHREEWQSQATRP